MRYHILILLLFCGLANSANAQTFSSRKLAEIGKEFPRKCLPESDSIFSCPQIMKGKSFTVVYNSKNEIEHLGISLFSQETKEIINRSVCNFIERILLELVLEKTESDIKEKLRRYRIELYINGMEYSKSKLSLKSFLDNMELPASFSLIKDSEFIAKWEFELGTLTISFPATRELIYGTDKKESDLLVGESILNDRYDSLSSRKIEAISLWHLEKVENKNLYIQKGNMLMIDKINSDTYYQLSNDEPTLIFNSDYPKESLANLFITKSIDTNLQLNITHRMYGRFTPEFLVPLNKFLSLFDKEFDTYCILYSIDSDTIKFSVVLNNQNFNFIHLLTIETTQEELFRENGVLEASLYTNIPTHNIDSLF